MNKYRNVKTEIDGIKFDSKKEARYYEGLKARVKTNAEGLVGFERQLRFLLVVNGVNCGSYRADFVEYFMKGEPGPVTTRQVVDVKGIKTPVYNLKKKLMKAIYGIEIQEV